MELGEYSCTVKNSTRWAVWVMPAAVVLAALLWVIPSALGKASPFWLFGALVLMTLGLSFATRYLWRRYVYRLEQTEDGGFDFIVIEIFGRRVRCVCRVSTDCFRSFAPMERGKAHRSDYDWTLTPGRRAVWLLTLCDGEGSFFEDGETVTARLTPDGEMTALLAACLQASM